MVAIYSEQRINPHTLQGRKRYLNIKASGTCRVYVTVTTTITCLHYYTAMLLKLLLSLIGHALATPHKFCLLTYFYPYNQTTAPAILSTAWFSEAATDFSILTKKIRILNPEHITHCKFRHCPVYFMLGRNKFWAVRHQPFKHFRTRPHNAPRGWLVSGQYISCQ